ncbi:MAG: PadR family transcriptional regulator [Acidobacteria bacterium]|nr:MAG: PadR family transcriptional regulator [Acidobacteriota bacterium]
MTYLGEFEQLVLLAILQCDEAPGGAYTVPIGRLISEKTGRDVARGALHTSLERLEAKGLVSSKLGEPLAVRGGRSRRYFTVTREGVAALQNARAAVVNLSAGLERLLDRKR